KLHRGGVARIDLRQERRAVPRNEVDPVDSHKAELSSEQVGDAARGVEHRVGFGKRRRAGPHEDAAAVREAGGAELGFTHELPAERKRHGVPAVGDEDEGARDTANVLLQEVAAAQYVAAVPARDAVAPAGREGLGEPRTAANLATGSQPDVGRDESVL